MLEGFRAPPKETRPRVCWHWMNGNVTEEGIAKDPSWMQRVGIAGVQNFGASLATPQLVEKRLPYMTPEWKRAFRFAAARAEAEALELAIAGSPGWSETLVAGGKPFSGRLTEPEGTTGAFQSMRVEAPFGLSPKGESIPHVYRDIALFAIPVGRKRRRRPPAFLTVREARSMPSCCRTDNMAKRWTWARERRERRPC